MRRAWLLLLSVCLFAALRAEVPVFAYVVCGADGSQTAASFSDVTNYIERKRLLMYGKSSDKKFRISGGDIYGLGRKIRRNETTGVLEIVWDLFNVEVGFWDHGTRAPASE